MGDTWRPELVAEALVGVKLAHQRDHTTSVAFETCPWDQCMVGSYLEHVWAELRTGQVIGEHFGG